jgi:hypothetical protein
MKRYSVKLLTFLIALEAIFAFISPALGPRTDRLQSIDASTSLRMSADILGLQNDLMNTLNQEFGLKTTDFTDVYNAKTWGSGDYQGECEWLDESKGSKLTGIASSSYRSRDMDVISLSGWVGPTTSVPHFVLSIKKSANGLYHYSADYVYRGSTAVGTDLTYFTSYYDNPDLLRKYNQMHSTASQSYIPDEGNFFGRVLRSPNHLNVIHGSFSDIASYSTQIVEQWVSWIKNATPVETRSRGAMNSRDDKLRQFFFASNLHQAQALLPRDKEFAKLLGILNYHS